MCLLFNNILIYVNTIVLIWKIKIVRIYKDNTKHIILYIYDKYVEP